MIIRGMGGCLKTVASFSQEVVFQRRKLLKRRFPACASIFRPEESRTIVLDCKIIAVACVVRKCTLLMLHRYNRSLGPGVETFRSFLCRSVDTGAAKFYLMCIAKGISEADGNPKGPGKVFSIYKCYIHPELRIGNCRFGSGKGERGSKKEHYGSLACCLD